MTTTFNFKHVGDKTYKVYRQHSEYSFVFQANVITERPIAVCDDRFWAQRLVTLLNEHEAVNPVPPAVKPNNEPVRPDDTSIA